MLDRIGPRLLWIDGFAGLSVGIGVLLLLDQLGQWLGLPIALLRATGWANLAYGSCSTLLATRRRRPAGLIVALVVANGAWSLVCAALLIVFGSAATPLGIAHLTGEGIFVAALAIAEWRWRHVLARSPDL